MKIIFCSNMYFDVRNDLKLNRRPNPISGHKFQENLILGLLDNKQEITVLNTSRVGTYPNYPYWYIKEKTFKIKSNPVGTEISYLNLPIIKYVSQAINIYRYLCQEIKNNRDISQEKICLMTFNTYLPQTAAMLLAKKRFDNIELCDVIGDLGGKYGIWVRNGGLKGYLINLLGIIKNKIASKFDQYVFLTSYMADAIALGNKPYTIVEGFAPIHYEIEEDVFVKNKSIFYAGAIIKDYGIEHLLKAFSMIADDEYELNIAGSGADETLVREYCSKDNRIHFLGFISPKEVQQYQKMATVLVSPRLPTGNFVKYSFPSKTMECLASGKPYIAHKLPCEPPEYARYIQYPINGTDEALRDKIVEVCEMTAEDRKEIGMNARKFIQDEKSPQKMCKKIVELLN